MGSTLFPWAERLSTSKKRVIQELVHGQECATQLQILFHKLSGEDHQRGQLTAEELVHKILRSFDETISLLSPSDSAQASQNQETNSNEDSPCCDDRRSEDSSESSKRPSFKDRRGCYKRKRAAHTWTVVSATMEDDYSWRKYGQKDILNSKHPRSYFRCTRKFDQGCKASKQVQRMDDDSQMFQTVYIGTHTCRDSSKAAPQIITDHYEAWESYSKIPSKQQQQQQHQCLNPTPTATVKQESKEETTASDITDMESIAWKDIIGVGDLELSFETKTVEFQSDFHFDESEFVY